MRLLLEADPAGRVTVWTCNIEREKLAVNEKVLTELWGGEEPPKSLAKIAIFRAQNLNGRRQNRGRHRVCLYGIGQILKGCYRR